MLLDVHAHVVPASFPPAPTHQPRWPCMCLRDADHGVIEFAGKAFRELDARSWNVARRVEDMDRRRRRHDGTGVRVSPPLLVRAGNGMVPTETALQLLDPANRVLQDVQRLFGAHAPQRGFEPQASQLTFRIAASDYLDPLFLPDLGVTTPAAVARS